MPYAVAVKWVARDGAENRIAEIAAELVGPTRAEPGCRYYQPTRDPNDRRTFFFFEVYDDEAAFESHRASEHITRLVREEATELLASRDLSAFETIDA